MRDIGAALSSELADCGIDYFDDPVVQSAQGGVDEDLRILMRLAAYGRARCMLRLWRNAECLVVPRAFSNRHGFAEAASRCAIPVVLRMSGGGTVMHGAHVVNLSFYDVSAAPGGLDIALQYERFGRLLLPALERLGINARFEPVAGAYCRGSYDIAVDGRKIAGTAGFARKTGPILGSLIHASIRVDDDPEELSRIEEFERNVGLDVSYSRWRVSCLWDEVRAEKREPIRLGSRN